MASCLQTYYAKDPDENSLPFSVTFDYYRNGVFYGTLSILSGQRHDVMHTTGATYRIVPKTSVDGWITPNAFTFTACSTQTIIYTKESTETPPVISSITWSPKGSFHDVSVGASFIGENGTSFKVESVSDGQVTAKMGTGSSITYGRGDLFELDNIKYTVMHAIVDGECSHAVIAKNDSANMHPALGEEVSFAANIAWNDADASATTRRMEWFYFKPSSESYTKAYAANINNWTYFATGTIPTHTFDSIDEKDIIFIKV